MLGLLLCAWLGLCFAWCARGRIKADGIWAQPAVTLAGMFTAMIIVPLALYLNLVHADWSWFYWLDFSSIPRLSVITIAAAWAAALAGAWFGGAHLVRAGRARLLLTISGALLLVILVLLLVLKARLGVVGTTVAFRADRPLPGLFATRLGGILTVLLVGTLSAAAFVGWELNKDGRRAAMR